jgi:hypothetical protein
MGKMIRVLTPVGALVKMSKVFIAGWGFSLEGVEDLE